MAPGQESGQGFDWGTLVEGLVEDRGSLAALAAGVAEARGYQEEVESIERGLRRLRKRGTKDGGVWGQRLLQRFGLPGAVSDRIRWMGQYHTRFTDLPASLCEELLHPWDRPPVSESAARIWLLLGRASLALRRRESALELLEQALLVAPRSEPAARAELALVRAYALTKRAPATADAALDEAEAILDAGQGIEAGDHACLFARLMDHRAYPLNRPRSGPASHRAAIALYHRIPARGPLFARCRRHNGLGWSHLKLGNREAAVEHARASLQDAGDAGSLRMRAMALNLLAQATRGRESERAKARAVDIAGRLEDEALALRFGRSS